MSKRVLKWVVVAAIPLLGGVFAGCDSKESTGDVSTTQPRTIDRINRAAEKGVERTSEAFERGAQTVKEQVGPAVRETGKDIKDFAGQAAHLVSEKLKDEPDPVGPATRK